MNASGVFNGMAVGKVFSFYKSRGVRSRLDLFDKWIVFVMVGMALVGAIAITSAYMKAYRNHQYMEISKIIDNHHELLQEMNLITHHYNALRSPGSLLGKAKRLHLYSATIDQIVFSVVQDNRMAFAGKEEGK